MCIIPNKFLLSTARVQLCQYQKSHDLSAAEHHSPKIQRGAPDVVWAPRDHRIMSTREIRRLAAPCWWLHVATETSYRFVDSRTPHFREVS